MRVRVLCSVATDITSPALARSTGLQVEGPLLGWLVPEPDLATAASRCSREHGDSGVRLLILHIVFLCISYKLLLSAGHGSGTPQAIQANTHFH